MSREGPNIRLTMDCYGCVHVVSESYRVQGDSGHDVYCTHTDHGEDGKARRYVGDSRWTMPDWCPLKASALDAFMSAISA